MNSHGLLSEEVQRDAALINSDITTDRTSSWFSMADYRRALATVQTDSVDATKVVTVSFLQATDSGGSGSKACGSTTTLTAGSGGEALDGTVEIDVSDLDTANGFTHIAVQLTSDNGTAVNAASELIRDNGRY